MERRRELEVAGRSVTRARRSRVAGAAAAFAVVIMITGRAWPVIGLLVGGALLAVGLIAARAADAELPDRAVQRARAEFLAEPGAPVGEREPARLPRARVVTPERKRP